MLLEVRCVMKKWSTTYRQPVGCLAASAATTTLDPGCRDEKKLDEYVVYEH
jgi:hypothetical protein